MKKRSKSQISSLDYNHDFLERLDMSKICSITFAATVQDAVQTIQDEPSENNNPVSLNKQSKVKCRLFVLLPSSNFSCYYRIQKGDESNLAKSFDYNVFSRFSYKYSNEGKMIIFNLIFFLFRETNI